MNLKNQPPVFVPDAYADEIEMLSKAALMDMAWDYAAQVAGVNGGHPQAIEGVMGEFRKRREIVLAHRKRAKEEAA